MSQIDENETVPREEKEVVYEEENPILYEVVDKVAYITLNRPTYHNSQNSQMLYALDDAEEIVFQVDRLLELDLCGFR